MAAPSSVNLRSLSGIWAMNKSLSDNAEPVLRMQGMSWIICKTLRYATIKLYTIESDTDPVSIQTIQKANGMTVSEEFLILDGVVRHTTDVVFGDLNISGAWVAVDDVEEKWLGEKAKWDESTYETNAIEECVASPAADWTAKTIWGFERIDGTRYHTRRVLVKKGEKEMSLRLVYDFAAM